MGAGSMHEGITRSGLKDTKEAAKACVERAYLALLAVHPGNREHIHKHAADLQARTEYWERRGERAIAAGRGVLSN